MSSGRELAGERSPLLGTQPSTVDAGNEALPDSAIEDDSKTMSIPRAAICVMALGSLIFLQGTDNARSPSDSRKQSQFLHGHIMKRSNQETMADLTSYEYLDPDYDAIYHCS